MFYEFPRITHIDQVRAAIAGRDEFIEADKGDYIVFNYLVNFEDTFPPVLVPIGDTDGLYSDFEYDLNAALRRECRGLIFDKATGKVIARRYHKFFNSGEKIETQLNRINFSTNHYIFEKLDGSMITPFRTSNMNDAFLVGTKMGVTDVSHNANIFINAHANYHDFIQMCLENSFTPIFEWCSRKNRIVVDYPEDRLVLTAVRHNETGEYWPYISMLLEAGDYDIDIVRDFDMSRDEAIENLRSMEGAEGYVIRFENGHMIKLKGDWYLQLHRTLEHIQQEKDLIRLILEERLDDAKAFLPSDLVNRLDQFGFELFHNIKTFSDNLVWKFIEHFDRSKNSKKEFALRVINEKDSALLFRMYDAYVMDENLHVGIANLNKFVYDLVINKIKNNLNTAGQVDSVRYMFGGMKWET